MDTFMETTKIPSVFTCDICDLITYNKKDYKRHLDTRKHKWKLLEISGNTLLSQQQTPSGVITAEKSPEHNLKSPQHDVIQLHIEEKSQPDVSEGVIANTIQKQYVNSFIETPEKSPEHNMLTYLGPEKSPEHNLKSPQHPRTTTESICERNKCPKCNKSYNGKSGLWKHKKKCNTTAPSPALITPELFMTIINKNSEIQNFLIEQNKKLMDQNAELAKAAHNTISNTNTNSNNTNTNNSNNSFNLNFFLNEQCKNAVNMMDFLESLEVTMEDLEHTGKYGYVEGITAVLLKGLKQLDMYTRPIHCSDLKREVLYIKNQDTWEKDDDGKTNFKKAIKRAAVKNIKLLPKWREKNPECEDMNSEASEVFLVMSQKVIGGMDAKEEEKFQNSIAKNVMKNVTIDGK